MENSFHTLIPHSKVGHIGMYRDEEAFEAKLYLYKLPDKASESTCILFDSNWQPACLSAEAICELPKEGI